MNTNLSIDPARLDPQTVASLTTELLALRKRVGELEGALGGIWWKSAGRGNMEFTARITCWQMDAIRAALPTPKEPS